MGTLYNEKLNLNVTRCSQFVFVNLTGCRDYIVYILNKREEKRKMLTSRLYTIARYFIAASISVLTWDSMSFVHGSVMSIHDVGISAGLRRPKEVW